MRRRRTLALCAGLAFMGVMAIALQGAPIFTGPRWTPPWSKTTPATGLLTPPPVTDTRAPQRPDRILEVDASWLVVAAAVVVLAIVAALAWRAIRRPLRPPERDDLPSVGEPGQPDASEPDQLQAAPVRRGLERALELLAEKREPRDAVERAWLGLEEGAADSGVRRLPAETPAEFVTRVVSRVSADRAASQALLDVYLRARFGSAPVTTADVASARRALEVLRGSWNAAANESRPR